jgi:hypothetical protein
MDAGAALPVLRPELMRAASAFNDVTYGARPGTEPAYRMIADLDRRLRSAGATTAGRSAMPSPTDTWTAVR